MILRAAVRAAGRVRQRVLVAGLFRVPGIQLFHRPGFQAVVDVAARVVSVFGKPFESPVEESAAHAIRNQENNLPAFSVAILQQLRRGIHRIVQRFGRLALNVNKPSRDVRRVPDCGVTVDRGPVINWWARRRYRGLLVEMRALQLGEEFVLVAGKSFARVEELVKAAYPGLIVLAQPANNGNKTFPDLLGVLGFQVVVDQHDHGNGDHIRSEKGDFLLDVVFENAKFVLAQVRDEPPRHILYCDGANDLSYRDPDPRLRAALLRGGWRLLRRGSATSAFLSPLRLRLSEKRGQE